MSDRDCSYQRIAEMRDAYPSIEDILAAGQYYLEQIEQAALDPVHWPREVLVRAVEVLEVVASIRLDGTKRPILIDRDDNPADPRGRLGVALYQAKTILFEKTAPVRRT